MSRSVRDPFGSELFPLLLQIQETDDGGRPTICGIRRDDDPVSLASAEPLSRHFVIVWCRQGLGVTEGNPLARRADELLADARTLEDARREAADAREARDALRSERNRLAEDLRQKTESLRDLQRERDPERAERLAQERVAAATSDLMAQLAHARADIAVRDQEIAELKTAKRRLREALDRAKEGRR